MKKTHLTKTQNILIELAHHLPYSIVGVTTAIILVGLLTFIAKVAGNSTVLPEASADLFHVFHPSHILFSAVTTTAMFWKHDNQSVLKAIMIGFFGSVTICGISDIFIPFLGGLLLGAKMHIHVCLIEEPFLIFPFALIGVFAGFMVNTAFEHATEYSHSIHVFLSSTASVLFLIGFGLSDWSHQIAQVFLITIFAVMIPCCLSDIVFPLLCTHKYCAHKHDSLKN